MAPAFPEVTADLDGWTLAEESVETLFQLPGARVQGATRRFEDERTRTAVSAATGGDIDREWRFVAATALGFEPSLPAGAVPLIAPMVRRETREAFVERLRERGLTGVEQRGEERMRLRDGARARLTRFGARDPVDGRAVPVVGWVCVWTDGGQFFVVTGGYPDGRLADLLSLEDPPAALERSAADYREEFVDVVRSIERPG